MREPIDYDGYMWDRDPEAVEEHKELEPALEVLDAFISDWVEPCYNFLDFQREALVTIEAYIKFLEGPNMAEGDLKALRERFRNERERSQEERAPEQG